MDGPTGELLRGNPTLRGGLPFTAAVVEPLIRAALQEGRPMRRRSLVKEVVARHKSNGGTMDAPDPYAIVKKVLSTMAAANEVESVGFGTWALVGRSGGYRVPLTPNVAIPLVREALSGGRALRRHDLARAVASLHTEQGGAIGTQSAQMVTKKALRVLSQSGEVENAGFGTWALVGQAGKHRVPLMPSAAIPLISEALAGGRTLDRADLTREVALQHQRTGGRAGKQSTTEAVKAALRLMKRHGAVENVAKGLWRLAAGDNEQCTPASESHSHPQQQQPNPNEQGGALEAPTITIEEHIGDGQEVVYIYFNSNERRLAQLEGRLEWECKIGYAKTGDAIGRILEQGIKTSMSRFPTVGLVIRTHDSRQLEKIIHATLRFLGRPVLNSPGGEWFWTSPAAIKRWYETFLAGTQALNRVD